MQKLEELARELAVDGGTPVHQTHFARIVDIDARSSARSLRQCRRLRHYKSIRLTSSRMSEFSERIRKGQNPLEFGFIGRSPK